MRVLVTGGAGYVGSITVERLLATGHEVTILDSLVTGHRGAVPPGAKLVVGNIGDAQIVESTLRESQIDAVLHCAALSLVGESMTAPDRYFRNNVVEGVGMLDGIRAAGVKRVVFSSSAAVYGAPTRVPIEETDPLAPINTYGATKLAFEHALASYARAYEWGVVALRYFNACGASDTYGEDHAPESHLIPNVLRGALGGAAVKIFGTDYDTQDGTAVRDYIHVLDLADAHIAALEHTGAMASGHEACNLGSGSGFSVLEVLKAAESVVGTAIPHEFGPRRAGDPTVLVASNSKARTMLGWQARRGTLSEMIGSAWNWHQGHPHGYDDRNS
jgi:UDP-glucose 4-epimerase